MSVDSIHILRRRSDGALLGVLSEPSGELLKEGELITSATKPTNIHGMDDVALALMMADLAKGCIEWARQNPDKPAIIPK